MSAVELVIAVPAAVGAAASFGTAGVLQHRATHETRQRRPLSPALLVDLVRLAAFRSGVLLGILGFALQVLALRFGPLILVQPLLVTGVLFYILVASAFGHHKVDGGLVAGVVMALSGLSVFLVVSNPSGGNGRFTSAAALALGLGLVGVVVVCLAVVAVSSSEVRTIPLAIATAVFYGATAALVRSLTTQRLDSSVFGDWQLYAIAVIGPAGFLLNQNAYQQGRFGSVALGIITVGDPLVAIGLGVASLGEEISSAPWSVVGEVLSIVVMVGGVFLLAFRAQRLAEELQSRGQLPEQSAA
jgi:drug/metabolite transporter (DMT)-like permease